MTYDEIIKEAFLDELKEFVKEHPGVAGSVGLAGGLSVALARKPGFRRTLTHNLQSWATLSSPTKKEMVGSLPPGVAEAAKKIADTIRASGVDPARARIAVSGTGGTGKSTMTRALASELKMEPLFMDSLRTRPDLIASSHVDKIPIPKATIAEQTHLINRVNPDKFDVVIHMHKDPALVEKQLMSRGRGSYQRDFYDYEKLHNTLKTSFDSMSGKTITPVKGVDIKIRGTGGFKSQEALEKTLWQQGIDPTGMSRQKMVVSASTGKKETLDGMLPYVKPGALEMVVIPALAGGAGIGTSKGLKMLEEADQAAPHA